LQLGLFTKINVFGVTELKKMDNKIRIVLVG